MKDIEYGMYELQRYANQFPEDSPVWKAIDRGGGQTCDVRRVILELYKAGYNIVSRMPLQATEKPAGEFK